VAGNWSSTSTAVAVALPTFVIPTV
jgi:hypothetical protein